MQNNTELWKNFPILDNSKQCKLFLNKYFKTTSFVLAACDIANRLEMFRVKKKNFKNSYVLNDIEINLSKLYVTFDMILNTGHYSLIEEKYRIFFGYICALRAKLFFLQGNYWMSLRNCDDGLLKGYDLPCEWLANFSNFLCLKFLPKVEPLEKLFLQKKQKKKLVKFQNSVLIKVLHLPSMTLFYENFYLKKQPLIIRGMVNQWSAFNKWNFDYLNELCGHRIVPIELGNKYTDDDWCQKLMTFHNYLKFYVFNLKPKKMGYLAQHHLLDQIPELLKDIIIPDYCVFDESGFDENKLTINVFIGPSETISPLHTDPRHNFFCQISGEKFVRLINPLFSEKISLFQDLMRKNTSQIDVEQPNLIDHPKFKEVKCEDFIVKAGDCLFIPQGYFHYVRALQPSISVSIWFGPSS